MNGILADGATLFGDGRRTVVAGACLANAALVHGRSQEDTCGAAHLGVSIVPLVRGASKRASLNPDAIFAFNRRNSL
jgi:hypothetical protein